MTLHGVRVITKLYFAIFAAFKEPMTLNLAHRSSEVVDFDFKCQKSTIFPTPLLFRLKFGGVPLGADQSCWGLQRAKWLG